MMKLMMDSSGGMLRHLKEKLTGTDLHFAAFRENVNERGNTYQKSEG